jgi:hypothetical protein
LFDPQLFPDLAAFTLEVASSLLPFFPGHLACVVILLGSENTLNCL